MAAKAFRKSQTAVALPDDDDAFVRLGDVLRVYPVGKSSWLRGVAQGRYPRPRKLSPRVSGWRVGDIRALLASVASADPQTLQRPDR